MDREYYMKLALELASEAAGAGEIPVGCVIVDEAGNVIGRGRNRREEKKSALSHAELEAIAEACASRGDWRLSGCSLYVTLEPCPMCAGAIINARISELYYGAKEDRSGSCGSVINLFMERYDQNTRITGGVLEEESKKLMREFFRDRR